VKFMALEHDAQCSFLFPAFSNSNMRDCHFMKLDGAKVIICDTLRMCYDVMCLVNVVSGVVRL
jgi:hypothetical protein